MNRRASNCGSNPLARALISIAIALLSVVIQPCAADTQTQPQKLGTESGGLRFNGNSSRSMTVTIDDSGAQCVQVEVIVPRTWDPSPVQVRAYASNDTTNLGEQIGGGQIILPSPPVRGPVVPSAHVFFTSATHYRRYISVAIIRTEKSKPMDFTLTIARCARP